MKLSDTVDMMNSPDYKQRFMAEYFQLKIRMAGLKNMLIKYNEGTLPFKPVCSFCVLEEQLQAMQKYADYLELRGEIENINLCIPSVNM